MSSESQIERCIVIFAKEPQKGCVKTRLAKDIGEDNALELYKALLKDTLAVVRQVKADKKVMAFESQLEDPQYLKSIAQDFMFYKQAGADLGEKMHNAFEHCKKQGVLKIVIVGSDCPTLTSSFIEEAFTKLDKDDVAIGPAQDGGYYLIGLKEPCLELMNSVEWSSSTVLEDTLKNAEVKGLKVGLLEIGQDMDVLEDLKNLKETGFIGNKGIAPFTEKIVNSIKI